MNRFRLALWIWLCVAGTAYAGSSPLTNAPAATSLITLTNTVTLANTATQILPARQTNGMSITAAIVSTCIALVAVTIALQQFLLGKEKFRLDLFEKRLDVYRAVELFVYKAVVTREVTNQDFQDFNRDTQIISFIFGEDITAFVNALRKKIRDARSLKDEFDRLPQGEARHAKYKEYEAIQLELYDTNRSLVLRFEPYLKFHNWKYGLIWPKKKKLVGLQLVKDKE